MAEQSDEEVLYQSSARTYRDAACSPDRFSTRSVGCSPINWDKIDTNDLSESFVDPAVDEPKSHTAPSRHVEMEVDIDPVSLPKAASSTLNNSQSARSNEQTTALFSWIDDYPFKQYIEKVLSSRIRNGVRTFRVMWGPNHIITTEDKHVLLEEKMGLILWLSELKTKSPNFRKLNAMLQANPEFKAFI